MLCSLTGQCRHTSSLREYDRQVLRNPCLRTNTVSTEHLEQSSLTGSAWYCTSLPPGQIISHYLRSKFPMLAWKCLISLRFRNIFRRFSSLLVLVRYFLPFPSAHCCKMNVTVSFFNLLFSPCHCSVGFRQQIKLSSLLTYLLVLNLCCYVYQIQSQFRVWFRILWCSWPVQTDTNGVNVTFVSCLFSLLSNLQLTINGRRTSLGWRLYGKRDHFFFSSSCGKITWPKHSTNMYLIPTFFCI